MIQKQVIAEHKVLLLLMLRDRYINELQEQNQPNEKFRSDSLIIKVRKGFSNCNLIQFFKIKWRSCLSF